MATSQIFPLFPTAVGLYNFNEESHDMNMDLVRDAFKEEERSPGKVGSNLGGWHSFLRMEERYPSYLALREQLDDCVAQYLQSTGYSGNVVVEKLWVNINRKGDMNMGHHHSMSALTGVYYPIGEITTDEEQIYNYTDHVQPIPGSWDGKKGGSLVYQDPAYAQRVQLRKGYGDEKPGPYNISFYYLYPVAGLLAIMPSHLIHHVLPFREDKTRISISFVCKYEDGTTPQN